MEILKNRSTHASKLDRWLGPEATEHLSASMRDWYGPPIAVAGVPGAVWAHKGGDFRGPIASGQFMSGVDWAVMRLKRAMRDSALRQQYKCHAGFSSLSDLIAEATAGKKREFYWQKVGATGAVGYTNSLWGLVNSPAAGANAAAAPGGEAPTDATAGAPAMDNVSPDTRHVVSAWATASVANQNLLCYDRIFQVDKTMNSVANEAVTGVPTRYQSSTATDADYAGGNFLFMETGGTVLAATAHDWGVAGGNECLYRNQAGTDNCTLPVIAGINACPVRRLDMPQYYWFAPLASGDTGIMDLAQMRCSAAVATGVINFVIGHPICWIPVPVANALCQLDYINTAFNLTRIFDDAALAFLEVTKPATNATSYAINVTTVAG